MNTTLETIRDEIQRAQQLLREQTANALESMTEILMSVQAEQLALKTAYSVLARRLHHLQMIDSEGLAADLCQVADSYGPEAPAVQSALQELAKQSCLPAALHAAASHNG